MSKMIFEDNNVISLTFKIIFLCLFATNAHENREGLEACSSNKDNAHIDCQATSNEETFINWKRTNKKYILYDVNPGEGFNLRRDVYMRIAGLVRKLVREKPSVQWVLVLPPWGPLYHWQTSKTGSSKNQKKIPWSSFFDLESLGYYVPVIEFSSYLKEEGPKIDVVFYLQQDDWDGKKEWQEKAIVDKCKQPTPYAKNENGFSGSFWGYEDVRATDFHCVTVQGYASSLKKLVEGNYVSVMIDRAEVILHDTFGDSDYWAARRSMRFSAQLRELGDAFRNYFLDSTDIKDQTVKASDWREMKRKHGHAKGGPFIGVHLRRKDFIHSRSKDVPSLSHTVKQLKNIQKKLKISKIFLASDASDGEIGELQKLLPDIVTYVPQSSFAQDVPHGALDGSLAIIDQWICTHATYFIGTFESTFSFRIQEEREILGFSPVTTFNRLCGDGQDSCQQPTKWKIVY